MSVSVAAGNVEKNSAGSVCRIGACTVMLQGVIFNVIVTYKQPVQPRKRLMMRRHGTNLAVMLT